MHKARLRTLITRSDFFLVDPLGNTIWIGKDFCTSQESISLSDFDKAFAVIENPAFIIEQEDEGLYYFGSDGWNSVLLIEAQYEKTKWFAGKAIINPGEEYIGKLIKKGKLIKIN
jgi:hypothetical protein